MPGWLGSEIDEDVRELHSLRLDEIDRRKVAALLGHIETKPALLHRRL
jgi:hypothetical protein